MKATFKDTVGDSFVLENIPDQKLLGILTDNKDCLDETVFILSYDTAREIAEKILEFVNEDRPFGYAVAEAML